MISLFIDTSLNFIRIAIFKDNQILDYINERCEKNMSAIFDQRIKDLFSKNNLNFRDVNKILAVVGPGSFTGIRVGLTFAKVLAFSLNKGIIPISELQVLASTNTNSNLITPLIDARRGYVYAGFYNSNLDIIKKEEHVLFDNLKVGNSVFVSYDSFLNIDSLIPNIDFLKIFMKNKDNEEVTHEIVTPNYLKLTEAEENLRKKQEIDS